MTLAVADFAERLPDASPPPELIQVLRCLRYPGALPFAGSLSEQPAGLLDRMDYYLWVYRTLTDFHSTKLSWAKWQEANPKGWELKNWIDKARKVRVETNGARDE